MICYHTTTTRRCTISTLFSSLEHNYKTRKITPASPESEHHQDRTTLPPRSTPEAYNQQVVHAFYFFGRRRRRGKLTISISAPYRKNVPSQPPPPSPGVFNESISTSRSSLCSRQQERINLQLTTQHRIKPGSTQPSPLLPEGNICIWHTPSQLLSPKQRGVDWPEFLTSYRTRSNRPSLLP